MLTRGLQFNDFQNESLNLMTQTRKIQQDCEGLIYLSNITLEESDKILSDITDLSLVLTRMYSHKSMHYYPRIFNENLLALRNEWQSIEGEFNGVQSKKDYEDYLSNLPDDINVQTNLFQFSQKLQQQSSVNEWETMVIDLEDRISSFIGDVIWLNRSVYNFQGEAASAIEKARFVRLKRIIIFNFFMVLLSVIIIFTYRSKLLNMIQFIIKALDEVASGDLSARLRIYSKDEFGKLSRDFNTVVEILWSKLETVQNILEDVGKSISNEINLERVEKAIIYLAKKNSSADGVAMYTVKVGDILKLKHVIGEFRPPFQVGEDDLPQGNIKTSENLIDSFKGALIPLEGNSLGLTAKSGDALFWKDAQKHTLNPRNSDHPYFFSSIINLPLRVGNRVLGVLSLIKHGQNDSFSDLEFTNMLSFGELAAISIDNLLKYQEMLEVYELNREIDIAADIQKDLLPQQIPHLNGVDLSMLSRTLRGINGDFYDAYLLNNNKLLVVICEVAGKGVPAALVIIMLKTILKLVASPEKDAGRIISELNLNITEKIKIENIASMSLMIIDNQKDVISYGSAGHEPLLIYNIEKDQIEKVQPKGIPVGLDKNAIYENKEIPLEKGQVYIQFTDGIPEARDRNDNVYGFQGIERVVKQHCQLNTEKIKTEILENLHYFQRDTKQWDDQTLFVMKTKGGTV